MRTRDFSKAPTQGRAESMFVWGGASTGSHLSKRLARSAMIRRLKRAPGHRWHASYNDGETLGVLAWFDSREQLLAFTRGLAGSFARVLDAEPDGYSNGVWRAEGNTMSHIERFTPLTNEVERGKTPPLVADGERHAD